MLNSAIFLGIQIKEAMIHKSLLRVGQPSRKMSNECISYEMIQWKNHRLIYGTDLMYAHFGPNTYRILIPKQVSHKRIIIVSKSGN